MKSDVIRNVVGVPIANGAVLKFERPVSLYEALLAKREAERKR